MEDTGKYVWLEDETYGWLPARILCSEGSNYRFQVSIDGKTIEKLDLKDKHYPEVHTSCLKGVDDLLLLGDLDAQTLLHNTRVRFSKDNIYTFIGMPILIAVNPYKSLNIYNDEKIKHYKKYFTKLKTNPNNIEAPFPHLYHIGEAAYQDMLTERKNQSIIISGESGSGKTQSTKIILKYLAVSSLYCSKSEMNDQNSNSVNNSNSTNNTNSTQNQTINEEKITVEKQVLDSNPLMEAFGNAKTVKNNNSSRFGKFIQVNFSSNGRILSAKIYNYLLEKSRIVSIQPSERNYHIFYQLIRGANQKEREKYQIRELKHFNYLNKGCYDVDETDDVANFLETKECMLKLKFKPEELSYIFAVIMGILYLGNVNFLEEDFKTSGIGSIIDPICKSDFLIASELLGLEPTTLTNVLTKRRMKDPINNSYLERLLTIDKAYNSRDALAKTIYSKVFDFIIRRVNQAISNAEEMKTATNVLKIGLLDIFGFENFEINSFEQLCINYANERLQQYFNNHIFKLEQEEYKKEQIDYTTVEFKDNNEIIELIDAPKKSLFSYLDSEAITPNGSDSNFEANVYKYLESNPHLNSEDRIEEFISIYHYAGEVYYNTYGFLEKNIDQVTQDSLDALQGSKSKLLKKIFEKKEEVDPKKGKGKSTSSNTGVSKLQSDSLSKQFKKQLDELMKMLSQSNPRYVRCIKPNPNKRPQEIDSLDVSDQLLSAGVLEAIKIRKQGYSIRRTHEEFVKRYLRLFPDLTHKIKFYEEKGNFKEPSLQMWEFFAKIPEMKTLMDQKNKYIQFGITKVFMKEEVKDILEYKLNKIKFIQRIQNNFRRWRIQRKVMKTLKAIRKIQAVYKGKLFRIFYKKLKNAIKLQRAIRRFLNRIIIWKNVSKIAREQKILREKERLKKIEEERLKKLEEEKKKNPNFNLHESDINFDVKETINTDNNQFFKDNSSFDSKDRNLFTKSKGPSARNRMSKIDPDGLSNKNNIGDISSSEVQLINDLKSLTKKPTARKTRINEKNPFSELLSSNIGNVLDNELKQSLQNLKDELENTRLEKEKLVQELNNRKEELKRKDTEIEILKTSTPQKISFENNDKTSEFDTNGKLGLTENERSKYQEEIRKLKQDLSDKEGNLDILNLKIDELVKSNRDLQSINDGLNDQLLKRKEKFDTEMMSLYNQMKELEIKKNATGNMSNSNNDQNNANRIQNNFENEAKKQISEAKQENKVLAKKYDDIKSKYEKELSNLKIEINNKDSKLTDLESQILKKEKQIAQITQKNTDLIRDNSEFKTEIDTLNIKMNNLVKNSDINRENIQEFENEINKLKKDNENKLHKKDQELNDLKDALETMRSNNERLKKMEAALKNELNLKDNEISKRQEILKEVHKENEKISDENLSLKKENYNLQSKLQILELEYKNKYELEIQLKNQEMKQLKENISKYEKYISDLRESINKKKEIIENKKQMNIILCDLAKVKKAEVQCIETLQYANTENIKKTLENIRANEKELLEKLNEVSNLEDYEYDSEEEEIDDGSDVSEYDEYDFVDKGDDDK